MAMLLLNEIDLYSSKTKKSYFKPILFIVIFLLLFLAGWYFARKVIERSETTATVRAKVMGVQTEITVNGLGAREHARSALLIMKRLEKLLDHRNPQSEIGLINSMAGIAAVAVSKDTFDIINRSITFSRMLGSSFDITIGPLTDLWNHSIKVNKKPPPPGDILDAKKLVNWRDVEIDQALLAIKLSKRGMKINLDAVGKGYAVAKARNYLVSKGVKSAMINMGSSIAVIGKRQDGKLWRVGIRHPRNPLKIIGSLELLPGQALSTSGDYEQYFLDSGKRYHHIINPVTGYPAEGCQSVTVVASDATVADILSTSVFVKGPNEGLKLLNSFEGVEGLIVDDKGEIIKSTGFKFEEYSKE